MVHMRYPKTFPLKASKCPECKEPLGRTAHDQDDNVVRVVCQKEACGYSLDLLWIGDWGASRN